MKNLTMTISVPSSFSEWKTCVKCRFAVHDWQYYQTVWTGDTGLTVVLAFKVCRHCAKSKLIHILT